METIIKRKPLRMTALAFAAAQLAALTSGAAQAQTAPAAPAAKDEEAVTVVITGQRAAMQSAAKLKQNAEEVIDGVVAEEAGKLPDKSITEVLQRVVGVTMDRNRSRGDPEHFSVEGSGISVRGLTWGSSTLNGRESFSAGWPGRELSWSDVPPELMSAVIVHKNPPAELIEGGVSGQVDLRTALPFDYKGDKFSAATSVNYNQLGSKTSPNISGLVSKRWENDFGLWGALLDLSANETNTHNDTIQVDAYFPRTDVVAGKTVWVPKSASWRTNTSKNDRVGIYGALQWKKAGMESSLTYFHSGYKQAGVENALYTGVENSYKSKLVNPVFDSRGVLQSATYTYPSGGLGANNFAAGGLEFNSNQAVNENRSQTRDISWNAKWTINERWSVQNDLQWVHATDSGHGENMTLGTFVPSMNVNLATNPGQITFDDATKAFLANPANYFLSVVMPGKSKADADLYAWKTDARFKFDDPVLRDLRFGVRLTSRKASHTEANGSTWYSAAQPWAIRQTSIPGTLPTVKDEATWAPWANFAYLKDPKYAALTPTTTYNFANFFNGKVPTPGALVVPTLAAVRDYPNAYNVIPQILKGLCQDGNAHFGTNNDCSTQGNDFKPVVYDDDPSKTSRQSEKTQAAYLMLRFGFDDLRFPVEGSAGVRVVHTDTVAHGYTVFLPTYGSNPTPSLPQFAQIKAPIDADHSYIDVLPSLNLKMEITPQLQARFAFAKSMYRPSFGDLNEYIELHQDVVSGSTPGSILNVNYKGDNKGNSHLNPTKANSFDATLEWYPGNGTSLTGAFFYKKVRDIIMRSAYVADYNDIAGNPQSFLITAPTNASDGRVAGLELAGQTYLNNLPGLEGKLPEWAKGFGISANYTYIKSKQELHQPFALKYCPAAGSFNNTSLSMYGCDTDGLPFTDMPLQYLSPNAYNLMFYYDKGPLSMRLAYSWRSRFLQGVSTNGTAGNDGTSADPTRATVVDGKTVYPQDVGWGLPTWQEAAGQLDFGFDYRFSDHIQASFSASNLLDNVVRQTQQQHIGNMTRAWFEPGRSYRLALRFNY
ncbi:TonB-dependent receptor [Duganella sp. LjRoot269]|jgi:TonB-dependent receptor|uniref:TonB-dependent receptor n=1 Tax=Duganella sp. LjRoot269 TaxID=3342305 RepID=UPI003ECC8FB6